MTARPAPPKRKAKGTTSSPKKAPVRWTVEEAQFIVDLRENGGKSWTEIETSVPGRSAGSMKGNYKYLKALVETFTPKEEAQLRAIIADDEKSRWKRIGKAVGKSEITVKNKAKELGLNK